MLKDEESHGLNDRRISLGAEASLAAFLNCQDGNLRSELARYPFTFVSLLQ